MISKKLFCSALIIVGVFLTVEKVSGNSDVLTGTLWQGCIKQKFMDKNFTTDIGLCGSADNAFVLLDDGTFRYRVRNGVAYSVAGVPIHSDTYQDIKGTYTTSGNTITGIHNGVPVFKLTQFGGEFVIVSNDFWKTDLLNHTYTYSIDLDFVLLFQQNIEVQNPDPSPQKANLTPYKPEGWADSLVVSKTIDTNTDDNPLNTNDILYVDFAVLNNGEIDISEPFVINLYIDNLFKNSWVQNSLSQNYYTWRNDYSIGSLDIGTHVIKIVIDTTEVIDESDETDNQYAKTITIYDAGNKKRTAMPWLHLLLE